MYFYLVAIGVLLLDQIVKFAVRSNMTLGESIPIIEHVFHFTYIENPGAAFGMMANKTGFFVVLTVMIICVMFYLYHKQENKRTMLSLALGLVVSGAVGNLIDRVTKGTVTDVFDCRIWPIFNIADMAIVLGLGYLAYRLIFHGEEF